MEARDKPKTLEITILSAENLHINGQPATDNIFVALRAESTTTHTTPLSTGNSGGVHSWNKKFKVELSTYARSITFEVKSKTKTGVIKDIGVARIAVSDFLGGLVPETCLQFLSYGLRDWDGVCNGVINFSVKVIMEEESNEDDVA